MSTHRPQFWPKPISFDRSLFSVVRSFGARGEIGMEAVSHPDEDTRESIIADIATGQLTQVVAVFEFNPAEKWSRDITADIAEAVEALQAKRAA